MQSLGLCPSRGLENGFLRLTVAAFGLTIDACCQSKAARFSDDEYNYHATAKESSMSRLVNWLDRISQRHEWFDDL